MLHAMFQNRRPSASEDFLKVFAIYSPGGHLDYVTSTICINFHSFILRILHKKFDFNWPSDFRGEDV